MSDFVNTVDVVGDEALTKSIIDRSITEIKDNTVTIIGDHVFRFCSELTTADFPAAKKIESYAFNSCTKLGQVNFPVATSVGSSALAECSALAAINLPAATSVGSSGFNNCSGLTTVNLSAVVKFDSSAFYRCSNLTVLVLRPEKVPLLGNVNVFYSTPIASGTGYIYVPRALVDSYKAATNWSTYANQFRALEDYTVDGTTTGELDPNKI